MLRELHLLVLTRLAYVKSEVGAILRAASNVTTIGRSYPPTLVQLEVCCLLVVQAIKGSCTKSRRRHRIRELRRLRQTLGCSIRTNWRIPRYCNSTARKNRRTEKTGAP